MKNLRIIPLLLAVLAVAACTGPGPQAAPTQPPVSGSPLPPRPFDLPLEAMDPCSALAPDQQARLGVGRGRGGTSGDGLDSPVCVWNRFPEEPQDTYAVRLVTARGADYLLGSVTGARVVSVSGFGAVETQTTDFPADLHCLVGVDVAVGESLYVIYTYDGSTVAMTRELACDHARRAAEMAVRTIVERSGGGR